MTAELKQSGLPALEVIPNPLSHPFISPIKKINEGGDVPHFLRSRAYGDLMLFIFQLNRSLFPSIIPQKGSPPLTKAWELDSPDVNSPPAVSKLQALLADLEGLIESAPPDPGPRRFGNVAFRRWYELAAARAPELLLRSLPQVPREAHVEIVPYLLGSFGSAQRLDYGSGHELSFIAFLAGLWKLGVFVGSTLEVEEMSRAVALGVVQPYLVFVRRLITTYTLEPAGSHGVWGLDDHSFVPYIFGSAQLGKPIAMDEKPPPPTPTEGSREDAPPQADVTDAGKSRRWAESNMYFSAITFIHDVKKGPFWEHSPMLYDISGVRAGWSKINKGMLKMYVAEVLGKFPVVQHFPFGSLFSWDLDPAAGDAGGGAAYGIQGAEHLSSINGPSPGADPLRPLDRDGATKATQAAKPIPPPPPGGTKAHWTSVTPAPPPVRGTMKAPWVNQSQRVVRGGPSIARKDVARDPTTVRGQEIMEREGAEDGDPPRTMAPWAKQ